MPKVYAYIDETGDRGSSSSSSPIFGMAAILVREADAPALRAAVVTLRGDFSVPADKVLSWKEHVKTHDRRRRAVEVLRAVPGIKVCYAYVRKSDLRADSYKTDKSLFYNYVALKIFKSVIWAASWDLGAGTDDLHVRYGHVKHHDHTATEAYLRRQAPMENVSLNTIGSVRWVSADRYAESQAADLFGGFLKAATWPSGQFDYVEPSYLLDVWPCIRKSESCVIPLGLMSLPESHLVTREPWFPCGSCKRIA